MVFHKLNNVFQVVKRVPTYTFCFNEYSFLFTYDLFVVTFSSPKDFFNLTVVRFQFSSNS